MQDLVEGRVGRINNYWYVRTKDEFGVQDERYFIFSEGAFDYWRKFETDAHYRIKARRLINKIDTDKLNTKERLFIAKLFRKSCRGTTKGQYGYLVGIYERNPF